MSGTPEESAAGLTLEEMKTAATEAGFDPALVERAAMLIPRAAPTSLWVKLVGGPLLHEQRASFPRRLDEETAARLLAVVRSQATRRGTGESSAVAMSWRAGGEMSELLVNAHVEDDGTTVIATVDRHNGLLLTTIGTIGGVFASVMAAIAAAEETTISPYLVLGTGVAGSLALARAYWASSTRRARHGLEVLMHAVERTLRREPKQQSPVTSGPPAKTNLAEKLEQISEHWTPRLAARVNETDVKLVKLHGEFVWHRHDAEDELFLVLQGRLLMQFRDDEEWVEEGEFILVPRGVEHRPVAPEEVHVLLIEPAGTVNTGNVQSERTVEVVEPI